VAIFDYTPLHAKTGIAHRRLKPLLGILDPDNTRSMPRQVAAASGFDVLSHAIRVVYCLLLPPATPAGAFPSSGPPTRRSNPISDVWSLEALRWVSNISSAPSRTPTTTKRARRCSLPLLRRGRIRGMRAFHRSRPIMKELVPYPVRRLVRDLIRQKQIPDRRDLVRSMPSPSRSAARDDRSILMRRPCSPKIHSRRPVRSSWVED